MSAPGFKPVVVKRFTYLPNGAGVEVQFDGDPLPATYRSESALLNALTEEQLKAVREFIKHNAGRDPESMLDAKRKDEHDHQVAALKYAAAAAIPAPSADPWAHRSMGMRCHTCMWFAPKTPDTPKAVPLGRCRRHAPTMSGFPAVYADDWCGDHKLKASIR